MKKNEVINKKEISISIHVDGYYGLTVGVPKVLELLDKYNIKATFFVNMGREANIFQILKYRRKSKVSEKDRGISGRYTFEQKIKILLLNRRLGHKYKKLLKSIKSRGHEVEPHCWSHLLWSKNFDKLNHHSEIKKMKNSYFNIFNENPKGFAPPTWKYNRNIINILRNEGFEYLSITSDWSKANKKNGIKIVPLSFDYNIEELITKGHSNKKILEIYKREFNKEFIHVYFHADYEGILGKNLFEEVLKLIGDRKFLTCLELSRKSE